MIRHFTNQLFGYGFVAYKQSKNLNFVFSGFFFLMSQHVARSYWKLKGFITGFHIYTSTFSVKSFPLSKKVFGEHLICSLVSNRMELTACLTLIVTLVYVMEVVYSLFFVHCFVSQY